MDLDFGKHFFHYTKQSVAFDHILGEGQLRFSPYSKMRDPVENKKPPIGAAYYEGAEAPPEGNPSHPVERWVRFNEELDPIWNSAKLLSLSIDVEIPGAEEWFGRGWARVRMWEQYADRHEGVCLVFDRSQLTRSISESLESQGLAQPYHREVEYVTTGLGHTLILDQMAGEMDAAFVSNYVEKHHDVLFFQKSADWQTEFEYRFVVTAPGEDYVRVHCRDALVAVALGEQFPSEDWGIAINACDEAGAEPLRLDWSLGRPRLTQFVR